MFIVFEWFMLLVFLLWVECLCNWLSMESWCDWVVCMIECLEKYVDWWVGDV